jgi:hypothetical protein
MDPGIEETPRVASILKFPTDLTAILRFDRDVALIMGSTLWFYAPFCNRRQATGSLIYRRYDHAAPLTAACVVRLPGCYAAAAVPGAFDPGAGDAPEANLLLLDAAASFLVVDPARALVCAAFSAPGITAGREIRAIRGSRVRPGEFAALAGAEVLICQLGLDPRAQRPGAAVVSVHAFAAAFVHEFATGFLALRGTDLLFVDGDACDEYCPGSPVARVVVDGAAVITAGPELDGGARAIGVSGGSFRVRELLALDAGDGYLAVLLGSWTLLVVDASDLARRMHVQLGDPKALGVAEPAAMLCGVTSDGIALLVYIFGANTAVAVEVPLALLDCEEDTDDDE